MAASVARPIPRARRPVRRPRMRTRTPYGTVAVRRRSGAPARSRPGSSQAARRAAAVAPRPLGTWPRPASGFGGNDRGAGAGATGTGVATGAGVAAAPEPSPGSGPGGAGVAGGVGDRQAQAPRAVRHEPRVHVDRPAQGLRAGRHAVGAAAVGGFERPDRDAAERDRDATDAGVA